MTLLKLLEAVCAQFPWRDIYIYMKYIYIYIYIV